MKTLNIFDRTLKRRMAEKRSQLGFTLIEVMVVIAIIGIMATLIVPQIMSKPDEARVAKALRGGIGSMPSFSGSLKAEEIDALARYVARASGGAEKSR